MNKERRIISMCILAIGLAVSLGCALTPTTPTPTSTPSPTSHPTSTPTLTPSPTPVSTQTIGDTVVGQRWSIGVVKAEAGSKFRSYYYEEDATVRFVIISVEYTYLGEDKVMFLPESVVLAYIGSVGLTGWAKTPEFYNSEASSVVTDFEENTLADYLDPGDSQTDTFVYSFAKEYTEFVLYFPETLPIVITLE